MIDKFFIESIDGCKESIKDFEKGLQKVESIHIKLKNMVLGYTEQESQKNPKTEYEKKLINLDINIQDLRLRLSDYQLTSEHRQLQYMKDNADLVSLMVLFVSMLPDIKNNEEVIKKFDNLRKRIEPKWDLLEQSMTKAIANFEKNNGDPNGV